jgi:predicted DNA-binding transcriptional regulator YafY
LIGDRRKWSGFFYWHAAQEFRTKADSWVELRFETTGRYGLILRILSWMPDVKVLAPKSLRDRIVEKLRDGLRAQE